MLHMWCMGNEKDEGSIEHSSSVTCRRCHLDFSNPPNEPQLALPQSLYYSKSIFLSWTHRLVRVVWEGLSLITYRPIVISLVPVLSGKLSADGSTTPTMSHLEYDIIWWSFDCKLKLLDNWIECLELTSDRAKYVQVQRLPHSNLTTTSVWREMASDKRLISVVVNRGDDEQGYPDMVTFSIRTLLLIWRPAWIHRFPRPTVQGEKPNRNATLRSRSTPPLQCS